MGWRNWLTSRSDLVLAHPARRCRNKVMNLVHGKLRRQRDALPNRRARIVAERPREGVGACCQKRKSVPASRQWKRCVTSHGYARKGFTRFTSR